MKRVLFAGAVLVGSMLRAIAAPVTQEDPANLDIDLIIKQCEEQFLPEYYPDESERTRLIDECIEDKLNTIKEPPKD